MVVNDIPVDLKIEEIRRRREKPEEGRAENVNLFMIQFLTGHGYFRAYLHCLKDQTSKNASITRKTTQLSIPCSGVIDGR